ncbi:MAG: zf-HC2 domain-containing protein [Anaerolinea sp.]|nr:zf-HC2 domain-containing protein [Anaerolinea sp.]
MNRHVKHLLSAYAHDQLSPSRRRRVTHHLSRCEQCRAAWLRDQETVGRIRREMRTLGMPDRAVLARGYGAVMGQVRLNRPHLSFHWLPSLGMGLAVMLTFALLTSALIGGATYAGAAPLPPIPAEIQATWTPVVTEPPTAPTLVAAAEDVRPVASQSAEMHPDVLSTSIPLMLSPVPDAPR